MIIQKFKELGLKINLNKTKTMMIKDRKPGRNITINDQQIEWVDKFMYFGMGIQGYLYVPKAHNSAKRFSIPHSH